MRDSKLRFPQGSRNTEGKDRVDEPMRVADADIALPAEAAHLIGVVRNNMDLLDHCGVANAAPQVGVDLRKVIEKEVVRALLCLREFRPRHNYSEANDLVINWDKPGPMELLLVED